MSLLKCIVFITLVSACIFVFTERKDIYDKSGQFIDWIRANPNAGPPVMALVMCLGEVFFIPSTVLTVLAGFAMEKVYKQKTTALVMGTAVGWVGISIGAMFTMFLGRFVFQQQAKELQHKYPLFKAINRAVEENGLTLLLLLRMCPIVPFTPVNFFFGATNISLLDYGLGLFGVLPTTFGHVFIGTTLSDLEDVITGKDQSLTDNFWILVSLIVGTLFAVIAIVWITVATNRYLKVILQENMSESESLNSSVPRETIDTST